MNDENTDAAEIGTDTMIASDVIEALEELATNAPHLTPGDLFAQLVEEMPTGSLRYAFVCFVISDREDASKLQIGFRSTTNDPKTFAIPIASALSALESIESRMAASKLD